jgi:AraC family transcriptional regulator
MILHDFPDLQWLKNQAENAFASRKAWNGSVLPVKGWPTVVLNVNTNQTYRDNIRGPLSIFTNLYGESEVAIGNRNVKIRDGYFFVTNHDQYYTLAVNKVRTQTFNIHFGEYFVDEVYNSLSAHPEKLTGDDHFTVPFERLDFHNRLCVKDQQFTKVLKEIASIANNKLLLDEKLFEQIAILFQRDKEVQKINEQLPAIKNSTREEITKRLIHTADYIHSYYDKDLSLDELAEVACLSKFHFLRLFKIAFNKTPHQFVTEVKIERAKSLLRTTSSEIANISRTLGFDNASSFSRSFYNHVGVYPSQYR